MSRAASTFNLPPLPAGAHANNKGVQVDSYGRALTWVASKNEWFAISPNHRISSAAVPPALKGERNANDCYAIAGIARATRDLPNCDSNTDGAIGTPPPPTVTSLTDLGNGLFADQNNNNWGYCTTCIDSVTGAAGSWLQQVGYTETTTVYISVPYSDGFEWLSTNYFPDIETAQPPAAYKNFPNLQYIYFNVNHFWNRNLACYLASPQSKVLDAIANDLNAHIAAGSNWPLFAWTFTFNDPKGTVSIQYRGIHFPLEGDYVVGTAFITPVRPNCPGT